MLDSGHFMSATTRKGFGGRLYAARVAAGFKLRPAFAKALGVSARTVARWEKGNNSPRNAAQSEDDELRGKIDLIAKLVHRTPAYLLTGIEDGQAGLPEVEEYLRTHNVQPDVAEALRQQPYKALRMSPPTPEDLAELCFALEQIVRHRRQRPDGDKGG